MAYTPQTWVDNNASYPLSAARMNTMESGISNAASVADQGHRILTTAQRDALTGVTAGTMIYNTTAQQMQIYIGTGWVPIGAPLVFTNEAARDAAITSPSEGMIAYLTAPTVPTATAGAITVYNGSVWVCTTSQSDTVATRQTTTSTSYTALSTAGPAVTLVTGTTALVTLSASMDTNNTSNYVYTSVAVSGATTLASSDANGLICGIMAANQVGSFSRQFVIGGLTAGTNTFTMQYRVTANTGGWQNRSIVVQGIA
jgi:hypothetical protein